MSQGLPGCWLEDQVEADLELVAVVIAGLKGVPGGELGEVRILLARNCPRICCAICAVSCPVSNGQATRHRPRNERKVDA